MNGIGIVVEICGVAGEAVLRGAAVRAGGAGGGSAGSGVRAPALAGASITGDGGGEVSASGKGGGPSSFEHAARQTSNPRTHDIFTMGEPLDENDPGSAASPAPTTPAQQPTLRRQALTQQPVHQEG